MAANTNPTVKIRRITVVADVNAARTFGYLSRIVDHINVEEVDIVTQTVTPIRVF